jgi:hypothetical protein
MTRFLTVLFLVIAVGCWPPGATTAATLIGAAPAAAAADCADDGHAGAPAGTPMYAARRAAWAHPPPCQVPDVDYPVGPDGRVKLVSPAAPGALPAGAEYDPKNHRIRCDGASGLTFKNLDFGLVGGGGFYIASCNNVVIRNVKITWNCASMPINQAANASGIVIDKVWIDGGGTNGAVNCSGQAGELINLQGSGAKSVTYSRIINTDQHYITFNCTGSCTSVDRFNSFSRCGFEPGTHCNGVQWGGNFTSANTDHNYYYNPQPDSPLATPLPASFARGSPEVVVTLPAGAAASSFLVHQSITGTRLGGTLTIVGVNELGGSPARSKLTLSGRATSTGEGTINVLNAYPIGDTIAVRYTAQRNSVLTNGTIIGNVFDGDGPIKGRTYAIHCSTDPPPASNTRAVIRDNYINMAGTAGLFYPAGAGNCAALTASGNKSLDTGATVAVR